MALLKLHDFASYQLDSLFCNNQEIVDITTLSSNTIGNLVSKNKNLLIFPEQLNNYADDISGKNICHLSDGKLITGDIVGFVGINNTSLLIKSRFTDIESGDDNFLQYMLAKVLSINLFDFQHTAKKDHIFDFLIFLFPHYLRNALKSGVLQQYQTRYFNDCHMKGTVDIPRHIRYNIPFTGNIAYQQRNYSADNSITQLIRHTIENLKSFPLGRSILANGNIFDEISLINECTPTYNERDRLYVINSNLQPIQHPYFINFKAIQKLCLRILQHEKIKYCGEDVNKIYGLLFSGAWLWEEYIGKVIKEDFEHFYRNKGKRWYLFANNVQQIIPDYLSRNNDPPIVADAKYIPLDHSDSFSDRQKVTAVYYKTIAYMYRFNSNKGLLIYPAGNNSESKLFIGEELGHIYKLSLGIPRQDLSFKEFAGIMRSNENQLRDTIAGIISSCKN